MTTVCAAAAAAEGLWRPDGSSCEWLEIGAELAVVAAKLLAAGGGAALAVKVGGCSVLVVAPVADGAVGAGVAAVFGAFGATAEVVSAAWPARMIDAAVSTCGASIVRTGATAVWTAAAGTMAALCPAAAASSNIPCRRISSNGCRRRAA